MPVIDATPGSTQKRADELYWDSGRTVEEIVTELKISRGALYSAIRPRDASTSCPQCAEPMVYTNRSNRETGAATCSACATEAPAAGAPAAERAGIRPERKAPAAPRAWTRWKGDLAAVPRERVAMVGGAAVLGVMVGAFAARVVREMI
ncbi:MAG: hypothetical protein KY464_01725 [Gemmatimonadetes bacterium]|nr:hypothetical protein [Gemmatimonadota bacterium]